MPTLSGITIRAARGDDRERLVKAFGGLDKASIYTRFFFPKKTLGEEELRRLTAGDGGNNIVRVATVGSGGDERIVGLGHAVRSGSSADIAFVVEEDYQGRGIATALLQHLIHIARGEGVTRLEADVLADNAAMLKVFRRCELSRREGRSGAIVHFELFLDPGAAEGDPGH